MIEIDCKICNKKYNEYPFACCNVYWELDYVWMYKPILGGELAFYYFINEEYMNISKSVFGIQESMAMIRSNFDITKFPKEVHFYKLSIQHISKHLISHLP